MSEEVFVQFTPEAYNYHYDCLRIQSEGSNFIVPIHAYPVMSTKKPIIPKFIDLGIREPGGKYSKSLELNCEVPVDFEYEIVIKKPHNDIAIDPIKGEIKGNSKQIISITYAPSLASTAVCEFELHLSEFDFQPVQCRISGSGMKASPKMKSREPSVIEGPNQKTQQLSKVQETGPQKQAKTLLSLKGNGRSFLIVNFQC
jgi:hypothetical protein